MFCKNCGIQIDNDSKFCPNCGTKQYVVNLNENKNTIVKQQSQITTPEIKNQVKKIESFFGIPTSLIIGYLIWFSLHLILLLVSDRHGSSNFWPFSSSNPFIGRSPSDIDDYGFSEFFIYIIIPIIGIVIYGIVGSSNKSQGSQKYKPYHLSNTDPTPTILGIILFFINIFVLSFISEFKVENYISYSFISLGLRIGITIWCVKIARVLNRDQIAWGFFGFFVPVLALICIGLQKSVLYSINYSSLSDEKKSIQNFNIAFKLVKAKYYHDALYFSNKAVELNLNNDEAYDTRGYIKYILKDFSGALVDINKSIELNSKNAKAYYHLGFVYLRNGDIDYAINIWKISSKLGYYEANNAIKLNSKKRKP